MAESHEGEWCRRQLGIIEEFELIEASVIDATDASIKKIRHHQTFMKQ